MDVNKEDYEIDMEILGYRLSEIMYDRGVTPTIMWRDAGFDRTMMGRYMKGTRLPNTQTIYKIAKYLDVSIDYLLCNEREVKELASEIKNTAMFIKGASGREIEKKADQIIHKYSGSRK